MLSTVIALLVTIVPLSLAGYGLVGADSAGYSGDLEPLAAEPSDLAQAGPRISLNRQHRSSRLIPRATIQNADAQDLEFPPTILGKWCNDHSEIWIFGAEHLTHRQSGKSHEHRVRYKWSRDRMMVYVDGYPDEFLPLTPDGTRMKLLSSGLDSSMKGWLFWRCPDLLSRNQYPI